MVSSIKSVYRSLNCDRIHQGDVLSDFKFPTIVSLGNDDNIELTSIQYGMILSQDCDLEGIHILNSQIRQTDDFSSINPINGNKFLPSIIIAPAFLAEDVNSGDYLLDMGFKMDNKGNPSKSNWQSIEKNNNPRYHFLSDSEEEGLPNLIIDFKIFYTLPYDYIFFKYTDVYTCSLSELFRESLSQRFFSYHSRVGLPNFENIVNCEND